MISIQSKLINFSIIKKIFSFFEDICKRTKYPLHLDEDGVLRPNIKTCPLCSSEISKNGSNPIRSKLVLEMELKIRKGRVKCSNKNCSFKLNVSSSLLKGWLKSFKSLVDSITVSLGTKRVSAPKISEHIKDVYHIPISSEYIRQRLNNLIGEMNVPEPQHESSGVVVHDEQFLKIKGIDFKRISTLDANNPNIYHDRLYSNRDQETQTEVVLDVKSKVKNLYAAVLDGLSASRNAFEDVFYGIIIQNCLFHYGQNVKKAYKDEVGYGKGRSMLPLQHLIGFFSILNIFFDHERELFKLRELKNEMSEHIKRLNETPLTPTLRDKYKEDYKKTI